MTSLLRVLAHGCCALAFVAAPVLAAEPPITVLTSSVYYPLGVALAENIGKTTIHLLLVELKR